MLFEIPTNGRLSLHPVQPDQPEYRRMLREAGRWDLALIQRDADFIRPLIERADREASAPAADGAGRRHYLVLHDGATLGRLSLDRSAPGGGHSVHLMELALLPDADAAELGDAVLAAVQQAAARIPLPVTATVHCLNTEALEAYRRLGFAASSADADPAHLALCWAPDGRPPRDAGPVAGRCAGPS